MAEEADVFQLAATGENKFWDDFLEQVAFTGLAPYYEIHQTGKREGTTLGEHVLLGDMLIEQLKDICGLSKLEEKICLAAYTVHDMNKTEKFSRKNLPLKKAADEDILEELKLVKVTKIFPRVEEYLADIGYLVRNHSDKYHQMEGMIAENQRDFKLGKERLDQLLELLRAVDVADLSQEFSEEYQKDKFLSKLNLIADRQYQLVSHRVSEHRGVLTNLIHNAVSDYLEDNYNYLPVFIYPEGNYYLTEELVEFDETKFNQLAVEVEEKVNAVVRGDFVDFINSTSTGIKVDGKCLELGVAPDKIMATVDSRIHSKSYNNDQHTKTWDKIEGKFDKLDEEAKKEYNDFFAKLLEAPFSEEEFHSGELIRAYYNLLRLDQFDFNSAQAWQEVYDLFEVEEKPRTYFEIFGGTAIYYLHYVLARHVKRKRDFAYDQLYELILSRVKELISREDSEETVSLFNRYLHRVLTISGHSFNTKEEFKANFDYYLNKPHHQCSTCGLDYEPEKWMKADVPSNIKVQFFSNRLRGGGGEPKRYICQICNKQFILEKINFAGGQDTYYLHFYPRRFYPGIFLKAFQNTLRELAEEDTGAIMLKQDQMIIDELNDRVREEIKFSKTKSNGNPLPQHAQIIGNIITLPLNCPGDNDTQHFIFALQQILLWMRYFNFRGIVSQSPIPPLAANEFDNLYLDNLPFTLQGLVFTQNLDQKEADKLWANIKDLYAICSQVDEGKDRRKIYAQLMRTYSDDLAELFFMLDRLIVQKAEDAGRQRYLYQEVLDHLENIIQRGGKEMKSSKVLAELGQLATDSYIKGKTFKRNSILKPLDIIFSLLEKRSDYLDRDTVFATAAQEIFDHIRRIAPEDRKPTPGGNKYQQIEEFVRIFREELLDDVYQGKVNELIADQKIIKSAYLFYYHQADKNSKEE